MEKNEEELKKFADLDVFVSQVRGNFIHLMINIELMFEDIIKNHYCKESVRDEFMYSVLTKENFGFSLKYQLVCFIIKNHYQDFYKENNVILNELATLIEDRNHFAHRRFFSANPENDFNNTKSFHFEHYKTKENKPFINKVEYTEETFKNKLKQILVVMNKMKEIYVLMGINDSDIFKYMIK